MTKRAIKDLLDAEEMVRYRLHRRVGLSPLAAYRAVVRERASQLPVRVRSERNSTDAAGDGMGA